MKLLILALLFQMWPSPGPGRAQYGGGGGGGVTASDDFNRADGTLGANWTAQSDTLRVVSNQASVTVNGFHMSFYNAATFAANQYSQIVLVNAPSAWSNNDKTIEVTVRASGAADHYSFFVSKDGTIGMYKTVGGVDNALTCTCSPFTPAAGDTMKLSISGSSLTGEFIRAGSQVYSATSSDSDLSSGKPGFVIYSSSSGTFPILDNWQGGDL